jgi:alpha-N-arabinofuranosidase
MELTRELGPTIVRYPGGNFLSGYNWEDGVGPKEKRPKRLDLAWYSVETNQFGTNEFIDWCRELDIEPMYGVNLGTRGPDEARHFVEYCNHPGGTALSDLRHEHGYEKPHDIKFWCLGNEMDGPWQVGAMSADDYGKLAARTASAMKMVDPKLELVVCGSSSSSMPTFGDWERTVLEHSFDSVDYISCHAYYQERDGDLGSFLASSLNMEYFIRTVVAAADHVQHKRHSDKQIQLSFDEWNVWYLDEWNAIEGTIEEWAYAPRLIEDVYSVADAVVFGNLLMTLLKHSDRVGSASLAQLVNVIAPIMTEPGGGAWRQTTFFPFSVTSRLASGVVLSPRIEVGSYATKVHGDAPLVDSVATYDAEAGTAAVFLVNRHQDEAITVTVDVSALGVGSIVEAHGIHDEDVYAKNTIDDRERVGLVANESASLADGTLTITLPPVSWTAVALGA